MWTRVGGMAPGSSSRASTLVEQQHPGLVAVGTRTCRTASRGRFFRRSIRNLHQLGSIRNALGPSLPHSLRPTHTTTTPERRQKTEEHLLNNSRGHHHHLLRSAPLRQRSSSLFGDGFASNACIWYCRE